ncbi:MAG TPA: histidine kinase, partial [Flavisolibacter sp.]|nr:histidine kinase [Flavisolibacter sp.]
MRQPIISRYWIFQLAGWGLFVAINVFLGVFVMNTLTERGLQRLLFFVEIGILFTHIMREVIRTTDLLLKPIRQQLIILISLIIIFSVMAAGTNAPFEFFFKLKNASYKEIFYVDFGSYISVITIWSFIYFMYHFMAKTRKQELDTIKLEALVKSLELKTIKANINPHFIFNALNGIRALIDEDPARARRAVTELSNILRSSLNAEKGET